MQEAMATKQDRDEKADAAIWAAVLVNAGLGAVPLGLNVWTFIGVTTALVAALGAMYGHSLSHEGAGKILKHIFVSVGATTMAFTLGLKFFAEVLKGAGIITMGGATVAGMALDAVLSGAVTYAVGYTSKEFFKRDQKMPKEDIKRFFDAAFEEGKGKVRDQKKPDKGA